MKKTVYSSSLALCLLAFAACDKGKDKYQIPTSYNFTNVNTEAQTIHTQMLEEIATYMETANVANSTALTAQKLRELFSNTNNQYSTGTLNAFTETLQEKTQTAAQTTIQTWMDSLAVASQSTANAATNGTAGIMMTTSGAEGFLLNSKGVMLNEIVEKGIMGACFYYQGSSVYLGTTKMDVDNTNIIPSEGTVMEHHWDEAFGYFGVGLNFPVNKDGITFWGKYCDRRDAVLGINSTMMNAFLKGRAAISNNDLPTRDLMIGEVRRNWEIVVASTAISYLNKAKTNFTADPAVKHQALSEAFGCIWSLQFGGTPSLSVSQMNDVLTTFAGSSDVLQANFYNTTETQITAAVDMLAAYFSTLGSVKTSL